MRNHQLTTPVAFLVFNRPETTLRVFEEIRRARPHKLLVVADGPRQDRPGETEKCESVRSIIESVDWPCEVKKNYSPLNMGCKKRVSSGLDWVFQHAESAIILEDDCIPSPSFFRYCEEMLHKYQHDERIGLISGTSIIDISNSAIAWGNEDYVFSRYVSVWGWASWRRFWKDYDPDIQYWPDYRRILENKTNKSDMDKKHIQLFDRVFAGDIDTWDYQVSLLLWATNRLAICPKFNLIENIGFNNEATHTLNPDDILSTLSKMSNKSLDFPLSSPQFTMRNKKYEAALESLHGTHTKNSLFKRIMNVFRYHQMHLL